MKLLVVKLHALGDLVIATPAFRRLREGLPEAEIHLLTTDWAAPAVEANPRFDNQMVVPHQWFFKPHIQDGVSLIRLLLKLRKLTFDAAVIFHAHALIIKFIRFTRISRCYSFAQSNSDHTVYLDEARHSALTAWELA
ncbi:MAG: hypothetical protein V2A61_06245, partial [Calditrichota bacterium]